MRFLRSVLWFAVLCASVAVAHMELKSPPPRRSRFNPHIDYTTIDYDNTSPLLADGSNFPCKHYAPGDLTASLTAGQSVPIELIGGAPHGGGHCEFSVSYDGSTFVVLKTIIRDCMENGVLNYDIPLPADLPACDKCIFAWSWVNAIGNREFYMNCADVSISGSNVGGSFTGPALSVANLPGFPTIGEFPDPSDPDGHEVFESGKKVTVSGSGSGPAAASSSGASSSASTVVKKSKKKTSADSSAKTAAAVQAPFTAQAPPVAIKVKAAANAPVAAQAAPATAPAPAPASSSSSDGSCTPGQMVCDGEAGFKVCVPSTRAGDWHLTATMKCAPGTRCQSNGAGGILCGF